MMVGPEPANTAWRGTDDCTRLTAPCALAIGARADIDRVLQHGWHRAVMLGRDEKNRVGCPDAFAKRRPFRRRIFVTILIVDGQLPYLDDAELQPRGRHLGERVGHLAIDRIFPEAADDHDDVAYLVHLVSFPGRAFFVRPIYSRASLRGEMRDRQMPAVSDRHEAKTEAQSPSGQRGDAIRKT